MLAHQDFGPVQFYEMGRSFFGRTVITAGIYLVDDLMIDSGPASCERELRSVLEAALGGRGPGVAGPSAPAPAGAPRTAGTAVPRPERLVLTHHHEDHSGNAALVADALDAPPLAHPAGHPQLRRPAELPLYRRVVWGAPNPVEAEPLGEELRTRRHRFEVHHLPGHAHDHIVLYEPDERWLFTGDLYLGDRLKLLRRDEDLPRLLESLRSLLRFPDCTLFCQHAGCRPTHQERVGRKLDWLLGLRERAVVLHEEGRGLKEIARELGLRERLWTFISRGEFSGLNLVRGLLRDAGADPDELDG